MRHAAVKGSARVSRAGERVLAIANFSFCCLSSRATSESKVRFGVTPKPARETRALPGRLFARNHVGFWQMRDTIFLAVARDAEIEIGITQLGSPANCTTMQRLGLIA